MSLLVDQLLTKDDPGFPVIVENETRWSITEFREKVNRLASALQAKGIQPGDRVAMMFLNQKEFLLGFFAVLHAGAVIVPINIQLPPEDIGYVVLNSGSRLVLTNETFAPHFADKPIPLLVSNQKEGKHPSLEEAVDQGDPTFAGSKIEDENAMRILMYTSGTTGKPKGVMLSEKNLLSNLAGIQPVIALKKADKLLLALPLFHAYGLIIGLYAIDSLSTIFLVPNFSPKKIMQTIAENHINILPLVPTMFSMVLHSVQKAGVEHFKSLDVCISGGAALPRKLLEQIENTLDLMVLEGYGLTETSPVIAVNSRERGSIPGSVGKPLPNLSIKLVDEAGNALPWKPGEESEEGEILVKGPSVMLGYYNLPEENVKVFDGDGYLCTGDLGRLDAEGNLYISGGRKKDLIIKAGENIAPVRIEQVLYQHPDVLHASVIGVPDEKLGEDIVACIELKPGHVVSDAEIKKYCRDHLPPFMVPAVVRFYDELPKNPAGKILKPVLRQENLTILQSTASN